MKGWIKIALFWLPGMVLLTLLGWIFVGALPGMTLTGDLIAWLMELPVITCYALGAAGATMLWMQITGQNLDNEWRDYLCAQSAKGDMHARNVLHTEAATWGVTLLVFAVIFFPHW